MKVKFQEALHKSPYEAGQMAGMQMDTIPEALENLRLTFEPRGVSLSPWLSRRCICELYWADSQGNFTSEFSKVDQEEFERGIRDWLRSVRQEGPTRRLWPMTQSGGFKVTPTKIQQILEAGRRQLSPEEFEELESLLLDLQIYGLTPWINVQLGTLMSKLEWELEIETSPEWEEALIACDRAFLGRELKDMCLDAGLSPDGHKKELCARLYQAEIPEVVAVMEPYLKEETPERLPQTEALYTTKIRKVKDRLEELRRKAPEEFYQRKSLIQQAIEEREKGRQQIMPELTLGELKEVQRFIERLYM